MSWLDELSVTRGASREEIYESVKKVMQKEFSFSDDELALSRHLVDDLDFDSIDAIDLAVRLEELTGLEIGEQQLKSLVTVGDIVELVYASLEREH